jgi:hypothetical protein
VRVGVLTHGERMTRLLCDLCRPQAGSEKEAHEANLDETLERHVRRQAMAAGAHDPAAIVRLSDWDDVDVHDPEAVAAAVEEFRESSPWAFGATPAADADAGAGGNEGEPRPRGVNEAWATSTRAVDTASRRS